MFAEGHAHRLPVFGCRCPMEESQAVRKQQSGSLDEPASGSQAAMTDDTQGTAPTSANFYYLGASGFEKQLPQAKAAKLFVRPEDLLVLQVTVYQLDPASGFITFDFPPQHIA